MPVTIFSARKLVPKNYKTIFFQDKFYSLKPHAHYFIVFLYLATWRAAKFGIFTHFTFTNLHRCSKKHQLTNICILSPAAFYECLITVVIALLLTTAAQKDLLYNFLFKLKSQLMGSIFSGSLLVEFLQFLETI